MTTLPVRRDVSERLARFMSLATDQPPIDPQQAALDMVTRILSSESIEDVLEGKAAIHASDVLGQPLAVHGVRWNESDLADGAGFYALIDCVDADGQGFAVTCGAITVMAQLSRLSDLDAFPIALVITEASKPTKSGYRPMSLAKSEAPF